MRVTIKEKEIDDYTLEASITGLDSNEKVVWTRTIGNRSYADPSYKEVGVYADKYYYQFGGIITAIEKSSGKELWKNYDMSCPGDASTVMNKDGIIYLFDDNIASIDDTPRFGAISADGKTIKVLPISFDNLHYYNLNSPCSLELLSDAIIAIVSYDNNERCYIDLSEYSLTRTIQDLVVGNLYNVPKKAWYADSVRWALQEKITNGTGEHTFSPYDNCTISQIITFLWRAVGSPEPSTGNPFIDVKDSDYFYKAALWAAEQQLAVGNRFNGETPCTRSTTVTYLWILSGKPDAGDSNFSDIPVGAEYAKAVAWAVSANITGGTGAGKFSPDDICSRAQIVTFLKRFVDYQGQASSREWATAYQQFVFSEAYLNYGTYGDNHEGWYLPKIGDTDYSPISFFLHDLNGDDLPELIIYNGGESMADAGYNAFGFNGKEVVYLGDLGFRTGSFETIKNSRYPGLYYSAWVAGSEYGVYYTVQENKIVQVDVLEKGGNTNVSALTDDSSLLNACVNELGGKLSSYTVSEIDRMGWMSFCEKYGF